MDRSIWNFIKNNLENDKSVTLLTVAETSASSPGRQGFKMAVAEDAEMYGTIGGGIMEKQMTEHALDLLFSGNTSDLKRLVHGKNDHYESSGLICGGTQTVIFNVLSGNDVQTVQKIIDNIKQRRHGLLKLSPSGIEYDNSQTTLGINFNDRQPDWLYSEQIGVGNTAYIVGGGHVGLAVSRIMKSIGFYVVVFDHRDDVFTLEQNDFADEKIICKYSEIGEKIIEGATSYVIIATPMHKGDSEALYSVINKNLKYIGMMGSKKKIGTIFDALRRKGVDEELLKQVYSPIGLEIEAETPEEIAVSIAAEIIKVKNFR